MPDTPLTSSVDVGADTPDSRGRTGLDQTGRGLTGNPDVVVTDVQVASDAWGVLRLTTFEQRRRDGHSQTRQRETYDRGNGSSILLYDRERRTVLLTRQFRYPPYVNGHPDGMLIEVVAGQIDPGEDPAETIRRESGEELGVEIGELEHLFHAFLSPGAATERQDFFAAPYTPASRTGPGGGLPEEGEDIEAVELPFDEALAMIEDGSIVDAKTIILLQWAALSGPFARSAPA
jgi:nudix-type nucleoside diphosphatase (YffH/AdpP family)